MLNSKLSIFNRQSSMDNHQSQRGFTLIELMIVVAIVAILAAIAIPNFLNYRMKARTAEAKSQIGAINTLEEAYAADTDNYITSEMYPTTDPTLAPYPNTVINNWSASNLTGIGFAIKGAHYYRYGVGTTAPTTGSNGTLADGTNTATTATDIYIVAEGDLDGTSYLPATAGRFYATDETRTIVDANPGRF